PEQADNKADEYHCCQGDHRSLPEGHIVTSQTVIIIHTKPILYDSTRLKSKDEKLKEKKLTRNRIKITSLASSLGIFVIAISLGT
ncbi:MAG: hypothetical protein WBM38_06085, partial [Arenicellales bacterium]